MAHFIGTGLVATDVTRRETVRGVVATFRLMTGPPGRDQVWIDIEAWGKLAGTVARYVNMGRPVAVAGRITHKAWPDPASGATRHRLVITAHDVDLLPHQQHQATPERLTVRNLSTAHGKIESQPTTRPAGTGTKTTFRLACGNAGSKTGRLWIDVQVWQPTPGTLSQLRTSSYVAVAGQLVRAFDNNDAGNQKRSLCLRARDIDVIA